MLGTFLHDPKGIAVSCQVFMKGCQTWSYQPYRPLDDASEAVFISRIAPSKTAVDLAWESTNKAVRPAYTVHWMPWDPNVCQTKIESITTDALKIRIDGLDEDKEYAVFIGSDEGKSAVRLFRTAPMPGLVVHSLHPDDPYYAFSGKALCSPSLLIHPNGYMLASMDVYGAKMPQNLTLVYRSDDGGESWSYVTDLFPCFWGKLFVHRNDIYMLATSTENGDLLIGRSTDEAKSFKTPAVLGRGAGMHCASGFHKAPMPVIEHQGRLWTGIDYGGWSVGGHASCLLSIDVDADLTNASNWMFTEPLPYDSRWEKAVKGDSKGCLEGNAVVGKDGSLFNILRYQTHGCSPSFGKAVVLKADPQKPEQALRFHAVIDFPGNLSKFDILYDPLTDRYYSIVNRIRDESTRNDRNLLSMAVSDDALHWDICEDLLDYTHLDPKKNALQYASMAIDGADMCFLSRTALYGAANYHDANAITFHRVRR